jgi:hypothetical protein
MINYIVLLCLWVSSAAHSSNYLPKSCSEYATLPTNIPHEFPFCATDECTTDSNPGAKLIHFELISSITRIIYHKDATACTMHPQLSIDKKIYIHVTGHRGPQGCEKLRLPHFLNNRLTDGGEVASLKRRPPPFTPTKIPGTHFCYGLSWLLGHSAAGRIGSIVNPNYLIGNRTRHLPACSSASIGAVDIQTHNVLLLTSTNKYKREYLN